MRPTLRLAYIIAAIFFALARPAAAIDIMPETLGDRLQLIALVSYPELQFEVTANDEGRQVKHCHSELSIDIIDGRDRVRRHQIETIALELPVDASPGFANYPVIVPVGELNEGAYVIRLSLFNKLNGAKFSRAFPYRMQRSSIEAGTLMAALTGDYTFTPDGGWNWEDVELARVCQAFAIAPDSVLLHVDGLPPVAMERDGFVWSALVKTPALQGEMKDLHSIAYVGKREIRTDFQALTSEYMFEKTYTPDEQLAQLRYILNSNELRQFQKVDDDNLQAALDRFWLSNDPTPDTPDNELRQEFYNRIAYADEHYTIKGGKQGWRTDMGRIYIIHGEPDEVVNEVHPLDSRPYIIWRYYEEMKEYVFYDFKGFGNYELRNKWMD